MKTYIILLLTMFFVVFQSCSTFTTGWGMWPARNIKFYSNKFSVGDEITITGEYFNIITDEIKELMEKYGPDSYFIVGFKGNIIPETRNTYCKNGFRDYIPAYEYINIESDKLIVKIPEGAITDTIVVIGLSYTPTQSEDEIQIIPMPSPNYIQFEDETGRIGDEITITGINFFNKFTLERCLKFYYGKKIDVGKYGDFEIIVIDDLTDKEGKCDFVTFGDVPVKEYVSVEENKVVVKVPEGAVTSKIKVYNMYEGGESEEEFIVNE